MYNEGISKIGDMIDVGTEFGIIAKSGSWYTFKEERVQGRDGLRKILVESPKMMELLETDIRNLLKMNTAE